MRRSLKRRSLSPSQVSESTGYFLCLVNRDASRSASPTPPAAVDNAYWRRSSAARFPIEPGQAIPWLDTDLPVANQNAR